MPSSLVPPTAKTPIGTGHGRPLRLLGGALLTLSVMGLMSVLILAGSALDSGTAWETAIIGLILVGSWHLPA